MDLPFSIPSKTPIYFAVLNAALGSFSFGFSLAIFNSIQELVSGIEEWEDKDIKIGIITALTPFGCIFGALVSGILCEKFGRKITFILSDILIVVSCLVGIIGGFFPFVLYRFISGISVGINSVVVPLYISEIAPTEISGRLGSITQIMINVGILGPFILAFPLPNTENYINSSKLIQNWWRIMVAFPIITSLVRTFFLITVFKLDTAISLISKKKFDAGRNALRFTYPSDSDKQDEKLRQLEIEAGKSQGKYSDLFSGLQLKRLSVAVMINFFQQLSGINAVVFYSNNIFKSNSNSPNVVTVDKSELEKIDFYSKLFTVAVSLILMIAAFVSGLIVDKYGRKTVLVYGEFALIISLTVLGVLLLDEQRAAAPIFIFIYLFAFGISLGPVVWLYVPELINLKGCALAGLTNWFTCSLVGLSFLPLKGKFGLGGVFLIYCIFCVFGLVYILIFAKETKGLNQEEIEKVFDDSKEDKKQLLKESNLSV